MDRRPPPGGAPVSGLRALLAIADACLFAEETRDAYLTAVRGEREVLQGVLDTLGCRAAPSQGNFVFARTDRAVWWRDALAGQGIGIRAWPGDAALGDAIRITCPGDADQFARLTTACRTAAAPEAILFDIDGVLADVSQSYRRAIEGTVAAFGGGVGPDDIEAIKRRGDANNDWRVTQIVLAEQEIAVELDAIREVFDGLYWGDAETPGLWRTERFIGARDALKRLAGRYPLAAVTGRPRRDADLFLEGFEIADLFTAVVTMEDAPAKPSPAPVRLAMTRLGVSTAWFLGDTRDDVDAARAAGVCPWAWWPQADPERTRAHLTAQGAARVLDTWMDLEGLLP